MQSHRHWRPRWHATGNTEHCGVAGGAAGRWRARGGGGMAMIREVATRRIGEGTTETLLTSPTDEAHAPVENNSNSWKPVVVLAGWCCALLLGAAMGCLVVLFLWLDRAPPEPCEQLHCNQHGACLLDSDKSFRACDCDRGWAGDGCDSCAEGWDGEKCDHLTSCEQLHCNQHGACLLDSDKSFRACDCDRGWAGDGCDSCAGGWDGEKCDHLTSCDDKPCGAHGNCTAIAEGRYACTCQRGWIPGSEQWNCDHPTGCDSEPCGSRGTCAADGGNFFCSCAANSGWNGTRCETCLPNWSGENCDKCANGFAGVDCSPHYAKPIWALGVGGRCPRGTGDQALYDGGSTFSNPGHLGPLFEWPDCAGMRPRDVNCVSVCAPNCSVYPCPPAPNGIKAKPECVDPGADPTNPNYNANRCLLSCDDTKDCPVSFANHHSSQIDCVWHS
eukprot:COSAG02_NODE_327_length_24561_cov_92.867754_13_plen_444_part_00